MTPLQAIGLVILTGTSAYLAKGLPWTSRLLIYALAAIVITTILVLEGARGPLRDS